MDFLAKYFQLSKANTTMKTEFIAGLTTFVTMAYILAVNPLVLGETGMDKPAVFTATALSAAIATALMAFLANMPIALAPSMGLNAFFAYGIVLGMGYPWEVALAAVFIEGIIFFILTITNIREAIVDAIPQSIKYAISCGIGLFIAFIGFKTAGIVVPNEATFVGLGDLTSNGAIVACISLISIGALYALNVRGALLIGIFIATIASIFLGVSKPADFDANMLFSIPSIEPVFMKFDFSILFTIDMAIILFSLLFVDIFDTIGTLVGVTTKAKLTDAQNRIPNIKKAFFADAIGTSIGAGLGTSTVTSYVESAAGVAEGGRTGMTALVVACFFLFSLFLSPIFLFIPSEAIAPALVIVGMFMMGPIRNIDMDDYGEALPAFLTIILMPLTFSVANGIMVGILSYAAIKLLTGKHKDVGIFTYVLALLFLAKIILG